MAERFGRFMVPAFAIASAVSCVRAPPLAAGQEADRRSALERAKSFGLELSPPVADGVPIRVIDAETKKPIADALVVTVGEIEFNYSDVGEEGRPRDASALLGRLGKAYVTSGDGTTCVAAPDEAQLVFAWSGAEFGRSTLETWDRAEHVIAVSPRDLVVEVVDEDGEPQAGVPIALTRCALEAESAGVVRGVTGRDGRAQIPSLHLEQAVHRSCGYRNLVKLGCLARGGAERSLHAQQSQPIRFVLPESGQVLVELLDARGRPLTQEMVGPSSLRLQVGGFVPGEPRGFDRRTWVVGTTRSVALPFEGGPIRLRHVETGLKLSFSLDERNGSSISYAEIKLGGEGEALDDVKVAGPTRSGEVVRVVLGTNFGAIDDVDDDEEEASSPIGLSAGELWEADAAARDDSNQPPSPNSSVEIAALLDEPIESCRLRVRWGVKGAFEDPILERSLDDHEHDTRPWVDVDGRATIRHVIEGTWSFALCLSGFDNSRPDVVVAVVEDVRVEPRQHVRDARLLRFDLRGKLRRHRLEIVDEEGRALEGRIVRKGGEAAGLAREDWFEDGRWEETTLASDTRSAHILVERFRPHSLKSLPDRARIVMKRGIPIRVVLDPRMQPLKEPEKLHVGVPELPRAGAGPDEEAEDESVRTVEIKPGGSARFEISEAGDWRVIFLRSRRLLDGTDEFVKHASLQPTLHVADSTEEQVFTVAPVWFLKQLAGESEDSDSSDADE